MIVADAVWLLAHVDGWGHMAGWGWAAMIAGLVFMIAVVGVIVWVVLTVASPARRSTTADQASRSTEILDQRYARGEIDRDEYLQRKADLQD